MRKRNENLTLTIKEKTWHLGKRLESFEILVMGSAKEISDPSDDGIRFNDDPFFNHGKDATFFLP